MEGPERGKRLLARPPNIRKRWISSYALDRQRRAAFWRLNLSTSQLAVFLGYQSFELGMFLKRRYVVPTRTDCRFIEFTCNGEIYERRDPVPISHWNQIIVVVDAIQSFHFDGSLDYSP